MKIFPVLSLSFIFLTTLQADLLPLSDASSLRRWGRKTNTDLTRGDSGNLLVDVRTGTFNFGWLQCPLTSDSVSPHAVGIYGRFRATSDNRAQLSFSLILHSGSASDYYTCSQGALSDSQGDWVEFYVPFSSLTPVRATQRRSLNASSIQPGDVLQISLNGIAGAHATAEFDRLKFLNKKEADTQGRAIARASITRSLLPAARCAGEAHPRLLFNAARVQRIRAKAASGGDDHVAYEALLKYAEGYLKSYPADAPFEKMLNFQSVGDVNAHQRSAQLEGQLTAAAIPIEILAAAYQITGDKRFGHFAAKALVNAARSVDADTPILNSGFYYTRTFYVRALAFGYDWLWPLLTPEERVDVKTTLLGFVLQIHADSWRAGWGSRPLHRVWNWDPGLVSCAGLGMLALEGETATAEKAVLFDLRRHLRDYLTLGIDRDGAGHEGPGYLAYGIGAGPEFAECLREQGRGDLFTETNWQLIPPWLVAETLPDRVRWNNLSDCGHGQNPASVYSYTCGRLAALARQNAAVPNERLSAPEDLLSAKDYLWQFAETPGPRRLSYPAMAALMGWEWQTGLGRRIVHGSAPAVLAHLLFYEPCEATQDPTALLPNALHFRGRGLAVSRTGFGTNDVYLAVEAGPHAAGHDQADKGSFTLYGYGADLAIDSGYGNDGEPLKSGSSHAHNMVLVNGQSQPMDWHNQSSGHISGYHHADLFDWIRVDAREAWNVRYSGDWTPQPERSPVQKALRHFLFVRGNGKTPPYLVVMDDMRKDGQPADYTWLWHIPNGQRFQCFDNRWSTRPVQLTGTLLTTARGRPHGSARFSFKVPSDGRYSLAGLVCAGGTDPGKSDSFWLSVNGGKRMQWNLRGLQTFAWEPFKPLEAGSTNVFALHAGDNFRIELSAREPEAQISKLALLHLGSEPPVAPDEDPTNGVTLTANDAELAKEPLLRQPIPNSAPISGARLTVFPVTTDARWTTNRWFATSCEGVHPRLEHTVRAVEPHFLMVLVPGTAETPMPTVRPIAAENGVGAEVVWSETTDQFLFGEGELRTAALETDGQAVFMRRSKGRITDWALLDGTHLTSGGQALVKTGGTRVVTSSEKAP